MAATAIRRTTKRKTNGTSRTRQSRAKKSENLAIFTFVLPLLLIVSLVICLIYLLYLGYQTVSASSFFAINTEKIDVTIKGTHKISSDEIKKLVVAHSTKGVLLTEVDHIQGHIIDEYAVKNVVVSRVLPDGIRVRILE